MKQSGLLMLALVCALGAPGAAIAAEPSDRVYMGAPKAASASKPRLESRWHIDTQHRFRVALPKSWRAYKSAQGLPLLAISPREKTGDVVRERMSVSVTVFDEPISPEAFGEQLIEEAKAELPGFKLYEDGLTTLNGRIYYKLVYGYKRGAEEFRNLGYLHIESYRGYAILYTASPATLKKYQPLFDSITESFKATP